MLTLRFMCTIYVVCILPRRYFVHKLCRHMCPHCYIRYSSMDQWYHWNAKLQTPAAVISEIQQALYVHMLAVVCSSHDALSERTAPSASRMVQPLETYQVAQNSAQILCSLFTTHNSKTQCPTMCSTHRAKHWHVMLPCDLQDHPGPCFG